MSSLSAASSQDNRENTLAGITDLVEFHGDSALVSFLVGGKEIGALVPASSRPKTGAPVVFSASGETLHVFDRSTGLSVLLPQS